jgi:hypothetical protein
LPEHLLLGNNSSICKSARGSKLQADDVKKNAKLTAASLQTNPDRTTIAKSPSQISAHWQKVGKPFREVQY